MRDSRAPLQGVRMADCDVVVIGGGLAGLACAVALCDAGLRVTVLERGDEAGGRAPAA